MFGYRNTSVFYILVVLLFVAIGCSDQSTSPEEDTGNWPRDTETEIVDVTNPATGQTWMDRNLGASRAATTVDDSLAYGDLYQWGRAADGHQKRNSSKTSTLSSSDQPGHGDFILIINDSPYDWRNPQNDDLWQVEDGINNPCPVGYRLPTEAEWEAERESWSSNDASGAFNSPLKVPFAGYRLYSHGLLSISSGNYWSGIVSGSSSGAWALNIHSGNASLNTMRRAHGFSVRCIKD